MKALRIILIIVVVLLAAVLIVPLFSPATAEVSSETEISLEPADIFPMVASFTDREKWDPWVTQDSTTKVTINPKPGYVGSTYAWDGEKLGTGRMEVISVVENQKIESSLWFGNVETPSQVEWDFKPVDNGTLVTWSFSQKTTYPIGRLGMMFGKVFLKKSFDLGLANLKEYLESMPRKSSGLGDITVATLPPMTALVIEGGGTMESIGEQMGAMYQKLYTEAAKQQLEITGPPFALYLDYDESTGYSNFLAGVSVKSPGVDAGDVKARSYPGMSAVQAIHKGPYEEFEDSYEQLESYIETNQMQVKGEVFEFYQIGMMTESDPTKWETLIAFPLR
jgi:effector-binding domain-containing protein